MTDLLTPDNVAQFRAAMRDVTDTFFKVPVTIQRATGGDVNLLAGLKPVETGNKGEVNGEYSPRESGSEVVERWVVTFNRDYLADMGLVDTDTDQVLISSDDVVVFKGQRFVIVSLTDKALFRGLAILFRMEVAR